eukprot:7308824-Lingulodinium_polyedra.AAC.1
MPTWRTSTLPPCDVSGSWPNGAASAPATTGRPSSAPSRALAARPSPGPRPPSSPPARLEGSRLPPTVSRARPA